MDQFARRELELAEKRAKRRKAQSPGFIVAAYGSTSGGQVEVPNELELADLISLGTSVIRATMSVCGGVMLRSTSKLNPYSPHCSEVLYLKPDTHITITRIDEE